MNGSDGMFKYEEIVLERVSLPAGQDERGGEGSDQEREVPCVYLSLKTCWREAPTLRGQEVGGGRKQWPWKAMYCINQSINQLTNIN